MSAIVEEITIEAAPQRVFSALTQEKKIVQWWTNEAHFVPEVGTLAEFRFGTPNGILQFEVAELEQDSKMRWLSRQNPLWAGTSVTWSLEPVEGATKLLFAHEGFTGVDETYVERVRENWLYFLASLKSYLEKGKGTPGVPPNLR